MATQPAGREVTQRNTVTAQLKRLQPAQIAIGIIVIAFAVRLAPVIPDLIDTTDDHLKLGLAHLGFLGLGALSAGLVAWLLRLNGRVAMVVGGLIMAVSPISVRGDRHVTLLVPLVLLVLLAMLVLQAGTEKVKQLDAVLGMLIGAAIAMSLWAIIVAVGIVVALVFEHGVKEGLRLAARFAAAALFMVIIIYVPEWPARIGRIWNEVSASSVGYPSGWPAIPIDFTVAYVLVPVLAILAGVGIRALIRSTGRKVGIGLAAVTIAALAVTTALLP